MDLFNSTLRNELGDDYEDLMQIIDDYLERPRRSELGVLNNAEKIRTKVEQQTEVIELATQYVPEPTVSQPATSNSSKTTSNKNTATTSSISDEAPAPQKESETVTSATATKPLDDDDVVYVSSGSAPPRVINLLTPDNNGRRNRRRLQVDEVITLDDSWRIQPSPPKRANATPTHVAQSPSKESEGGGIKLKCAVCMDDPLKNQPSTTICGHIFCKKCIHRAIKISKKCPLCNKKLNSTAVHRLYI